MTYGSSELTLGGVLFAPFVKQAIVAVVIFFFLRPLYRLLPVEDMFSNPPLIGMCVFIIILAAVIALL